MRDACVAAVRQRCPFRLRDTLGVVVRDFGDMRTSPLADAVPSETTKAGRAVNALRAPASADVGKAPNVGTSFRVLAEAHVATLGTPSPVDAVVAAVGAALEVVGGRHNVKCAGTEGTARDVVSFNSVRPSESTVLPAGNAESAVPTAGNIFPRAAEPSRRRFRDPPPTCPRSADVPCVWESGCFRLWI